MNNLRRLAASAVMVLCLGSTSAMLAQYAGQGGQGGWDAPPQQFSDAARRGFHDGMEGARKDYENHRTPDVNNRDEYRHPNVSRNQRQDYRQGFQRGYEAGVRHFTQGGGDHDDHR